MFERENWNLGDVLVFVLKVLRAFVLKSMLIQPILIKRIVLTSRKYSAAQVFCRMLPLCMIASIYFEFLPSCKYSVLINIYIYGENVY